MKQIIWRNEVDWVGEGEEPENEKREIYEGRLIPGGGSVSRGRDAIPPTSGDNGGILDAIFINSGRFAGGGLLSWLPAAFNFNADIYSGSEKERERTGVVARRSRRGARGAEKCCGRRWWGWVINYKALEGPAAPDYGWMCCSSDV